MKDLKDPLLGLRQLLTTESPLKMVQKTLFILCLERYLNFVTTFYSCRETA